MDKLRLLQIPKHLWTTSKYVGGKMKSALPLLKSPRKHQYPLKPQAVNVAIHAIATKVPPESKYFSVNDLPDAFSVSCQSVLFF